MEEKAELLSRLDSIKQRARLHEKVNVQDLLLLLEDIIAALPDGKVSAN